MSCRPVRRSTSLNAASPKCRYAALPNARVQNPVFADNPGQAGAPDAEAESSFLLVDPTRNGSRKSK